MKKTVIKKELNLVEVFVKSSIQGIGIDALALKAGDQQTDITKKVRPIKEN